MRNLKAFWPLHALYAVELVVFAVMGLSLLASAYGTGMADAARVSMREIGRLHVILAAPVILGFPFRWPFVKGLWIAYAWVYVLLAAGSGWGGWLGSIGHAVVVSAALLASRTGRDWFRREPDGPEDAEEDDDASPFARPAEAFLRTRRQRSRSAAAWDSGAYGDRLMQAYWIGFALIAWGLALRQPLLASPGFVMVLVCFVMHRRARGKRGIFFRRRSPDGR